MTNQRTILVADDDPDILRVLNALLQDEGFNVIQATDGVECLQMAFTRHPDLVVLDIRMPRKDGREVCKQLREISETLPILMLTALSDLPEKLGRFADGADDYLTKPFDTEELVAHIRALLRRASPSRGQLARIYDDGFLCIDFDAHQARVHREEVPLTPKEWRLLECLYKHKNLAVQRPELLRYTWGSGYEGEFNYLRVFVSHLRRKLRDPARNPRYIHTERDLGYRFETHN